MKINKITEYIQRFAKSVSDDPKKYDRINNVILPVSETTVATGLYSYFIQRNKDIEPERKPALHYQNIICGVAGATLANGVNSSIQKHQNKIIEELQKMKIQNADGLINGLKIAMPVIVFTSIIRFLIPVVATPISTKIHEIQEQKKNKSSLNIIA